MIPKVIHYCWFGRGEIPEKDRKCIESWKKFCPGYEIIMWNEDNYDVTQNDYMREAYECKKWGFVPDYARLDIVYRYGGFYFDTDVEIIKSIDDLCAYQAFMGFERADSIATGLGFGAEPGNEIIKALRDDYEGRHFLQKNGEMDLTPAPTRARNVLVRFGAQMNGVKQSIDGMTFFPTEYFCPMNYETGEQHITANTYSIHHYHASWQSPYQRKAHDIYCSCIRKFGEKGKSIALVLSLPYRVANKVNQLGLKRTVVYIRQKLFAK